MCGIWTSIGDESSLETLVSVKHRGPDDFGTKTFTTPAGRLEMAAWRLSIIDLSPLGHQPMPYADGRYWIVYNGEIYNYRELRSELETRGYRFCSQTDTEVILASYDRWGESCLQHLNGMFAFCLWDDAARRLFVARDRFGIKPLYYYNSPRGIAFASEIKQIAGLQRFEARLNAQRAYEFLAYGMLDHSHETLFDGVQQLRGGEYIHLPLAAWRPGQPLPVRRWYHLRASAPFRGSFGEAAEKYRELLRDSVHLQLRADVPVGSCLSGGLDSSTIVCMMDNLLKGAGTNSTQKTFTSSFEIERFDERKYVREVVAHTGVEPHYVFPNGQELFNVLEDLVYHQDEPFSSTSIFAQWAVFREARASGVTVMLDGQGGDEQLGSYHQFFGTHFLGLLARAKIPRLAQEIHAARSLHGLTLRSALASVGSMYTPVWLDQFMRTLSSRPAIPTWMNGEFWRSSPVRYTKPWRMGFNHEGSRASQALSQTMILKSTLPMLLHWEDRNSMAHSVEARVPFIDHRVIEFALSLPDEYKIHRGVTKWILRGASKGIVPERILARTDKMGFVTPEEIWMKTELTDQFKEALHETLRAYPHLFRSEVLEKLFEDVVNDKCPFSSVFWRVITFGVWGRVFKVAI